MEALEQKFEKEMKESIHYLKSIEVENKDLKDKLRDLEERSRRDNLRFHGITEYENESRSEENLKDFLYQKLNIQKVETERVHRIGKPKNNGSRATVAKFSNYKFKQ